jgi:hypothetical protein
MNNINLSYNNLFPNDEISDLDYLITIVINNDNEIQEQDLEYDAIPDEPDNHETIPDEPDNHETENHETENHEPNNHEANIHETEQYNNNILESISICRETYIFNYEDTNITETVVIRYIYQTIINLYNDLSLLDILKHIQYYYNINFPEYNELVNTFLLRNRFIARIIDVSIDISNNNIDISNNNIDISNNNIMNGIDTSINIINLLTNAFIVRFNLDNTNTNLNVNTLTNERIDEMELIEYKDIEQSIKEINSNTCNICCEEYCNESNIRLLRCNHFYHKECIDEWLNKCSNLCPICRLASNEV